MGIIVDISEDLFNQIDKTFKKDSIKILTKLQSLEENPRKGKKVGKIGHILIKELKFESFRFYFIVDGIMLKLVTIGELNDLLIKFIKMSKKNNQQETIQEIKRLLINLGY